MSQQPQCVQCGGTEYVLESGYYFCVECQVQSQEIHERIFDESYTAARGTRISIAHPIHTEKVEAPKASNELTSWEVLNYILKGLVDELILLGASKDLKIIVLQIWASYLMKNEIAFLSSVVEKTPRLGVTFKTRDAEIIYGSDPKFLYACKRPIFRKERRQKSRTKTKPDVFKSLRSQKYQITLNKKALAKADYESRSDTSFSSGLTMDSLGKSSYKSKSDGSQKSCRLRYSKHAKHVLNNLIEKAQDLDDDDRKSLQSSVMLRERESTRHPCIKKLIAIIRLALLINASPIQYSDLFRWNREGYLSVTNAEKFLPKSFHVSKDIKALFIKSIGSWEKCQKDTYELARLMDSTYLYVDIASLCKRYCYELCLPDDVIEIINKLFCIKLPKMEISSTSNYEGRAMAFIIVVLKFLFSLDDRTEYKISSVANRLNSVVDKSRRLFSWTDWVEYINCRAAVISAHCQATRNRYYPNSRVGGPDPFIAQWDYSSIRQTVSRSEVINSQIAESIRKTIGHLARSAIEPLPPSLTPLADLTTILLDRNKIDPVRHILGRDFKKTSLNWLLSISTSQMLKEEFSLKFDLCQGVGVSFKMADSHTLVGARHARKKLGDKSRRVLVTFKQPQTPPKSDKESSLPDASHEEILCKSPNLEGTTRKNIAVKTDLMAPFIPEKNEKDDVLYFPQSDYWIYHGVFPAMSVPDFQHHARLTLPSSFLWLLTECAQVIDHNIRDLYCQVMTIEKMYFYYLSPKYKKTQSGFPLRFFERW